MEISLSDTLKKVHTDVYRLYTHSARACRWKSVSHLFFSEAPCGSIAADFSGDWSLDLLNFLIATVCVTLWLSTTSFSNLHRQPPHWLSSQHLIWSLLIQPEQSLRLRCSKTPEKNNVAKLMSPKMKTQDRERQSEIDKKNYYLKKKIK